MGSNTVIILVLQYLIYVILAVGMYIFLFGVRGFIRRFEERSRRDNILDIVYIHIGIAASIILRLPALMVLVPMSSVFFPYARKREGLPLIIRMYGCCIVLVIADYLISWRLDILTRSISGPFVPPVDPEITLISSLIMAMLQSIMVLIASAWRYRREGWKGYCIIAAVKTLINTLWLYSQYMYMVPNLRIYFYATFWIFTLLDYILLYYLETARSFDRETERRIAVPFNMDEYYVSMEEEHLQIRQMYHDMKNQLMIMRNAAEGSAVMSEGCLEDMNRRLDALNQYYHTGCHSLDILLYESRKRAEERGIELQATIQEGCLSFMTDEDIRTIFVNAITNAIEACEKIESGKKKISILAGEHLNDVIISLSNTKQSGTTREDLRTTKKDRRMHGIGMTSIQRTAGKYDGFVSVEDEEENFRLTVLFVKEDVSRHENKSM